MATLIPHSDRTKIEAQVLGIIRDLLRELGNPAASPTLKASAILDTDLGLGSIERVELLSRLERTLGIPIPEAAIAEAKTVEDVIAALAGAQGNESADAVEVPSAELNARERNPAVTGSRPVQSMLEARTEDDAAAQPVGSVRRVFEAIYGVYAATVFLIWVVLAWLILHLMPRGQPAARMTTIALRLYFWLVGCRIDLEGREHMDAYGACIYVSNHTSYSDVLVVMALFETNYHFVAKNEINDMLFIGTFLRKIGHFAFERVKLRARSRQAEQMEQALLRGESLFVFAEGTFCPALVPSAAANGRDLAEVLRLRDEARRVISHYSGEPLL